MIRPVLEITGASKSFGVVRALQDIALQVLPGEVHGLIGQNGAGKSTLMAVASGALRPDAGRVLIDGQEALGDPQLARRLGLAIVRQEPSLMPDLTVAENLFLGLPLDRRPSVHRIDDWADGLLTAWKQDVSVRGGDRVDALNSEQRFIVEIVKALAVQPRVLVLDEPTEHLLGDDVARLFARIKAVAATGAGVIYISHRIREVREIADRVTVLRDGVGQGTYEVDTLSEAAIVELIVGTAISRDFPAKRSVAGTSTDADTTVLATDRWSGDGFQEVSIELKRGEIVGLAGIDGNGQREFMRALAGLSRSQGPITVSGEPVMLRNPHDASAHRLQYVSGDRHHESVFEDLTVRENFSLRSLGADRRFGFVDRRHEAARAVEATRSMAVKLSGIEASICSLSGGNQQKVVIGGVLASACSVLLIDEPTQGVDIGSRMEIYRILRETTRQGAAMLVVSSDAAELAGLSDRVLVFSRGKVVRELEGAQVSENDIVAGLLTATSERHRHGARDGAASWKRFWALAATDWAPLVMVLVAIGILGVYTTLINESYLSARNLGGMLALVATLAMAACGQQALMLVGGIDLSVGPLMGLCVVVMSFFLSGAATPDALLAAGAMLVVVSLAVGLLNWFLVGPVGLHPMVATLSTFMALQAVSLLLRPTPDGLIDDGVMDAVNLRLGFVPLALVAAVALAAGLDYVLFRRPYGLAFRGFGSRADVARVAGIDPTRIRLVAYLACSLICGLAAIPLMGQVGIGDPKAGIDYTLASIAAVVIGGGSLFGARGSFVGAVLGAVLIAQVNVVTSFLALSDAWQSYLLGFMILAAVALHSKSRHLALAR